MSLRKNVADLRKEYEKGTLEPSDLHDDPIIQFEDWFALAVEEDSGEANAMTLATASADGKPSARLVLLKGFNDHGFIFYTNYKSRKSQEMEANNQVTLLFWWAELERQVRIEGQVSKVSTYESDAYYQSRDRGSRLGAWVSPQSEEIESREVLNDRMRRIVARYEGKDFIPRPDYWGGWIVEPSEIEFWQGRPNRLHDRIVYRREADGKWRKFRLAP